MKRVVLNIPRQTTKEKVVLCIGKKLWEEIPFDLAVYVTDLHQAHVSLHTRVALQKKHVVGRTFVDRPRIS